MRQIFVDLDGVLGDFFEHYFQKSGVLLDKYTEPPANIYSNIRHYGEFYFDQPLMKDARELWEGIRQFHPNPIILSGIPYSIPGVADQKRRWVNKYFGSTTPLICCHSKDKIKHAKPGDILIDDRTKYRGYWIEGGGEFILHIDARTSLIALHNLYTVRGSAATMPF